MEGRTIVRVFAVARGGLLLATSTLASSLIKRKKSFPESFEPNAWIRIDADGTVLVRVDRSEMGQGIMTALPMLVAEELDVDLADVTVEFATGKPEYAKPTFGIQITSASSSVREGWLSLRYAGATARAMLVKAAASDWNVDCTSCRTEAGHVIHSESGRRASYGTLVEHAAKVRLPKISLKARKDFRLIGKPIKQLGAADIVAGRAIFGSDIRLPNLLTAVVARPPKIGATIIRSDDQVTRQCSGVHEVIQIESGVAVVADDFWHAYKGRQALNVEWQEAMHASKPDMRTVQRELRRIAHDGPVCVVRSEGRYQRAHRRAARLVTAEYETPYQAHATMEPMNCTADVTEHGCDIWAPTQNPDGARLVAAEITGLPLSLIRVHVSLLGGGFGRRQETDYVSEAVELSKRLNRPIKVMWTREDDLQHDYYGPAALSRIEAALDAQDRIIGWHHRTVSSSIWKRIAEQYADLLFTRSLPRWVRRAGRKVARTTIALSQDPNIGEGAKDLPYDIPNLVVDYGEFDPGIPVGPWRSVGYYANIFAIESFIDEIAAVVKKDPFLLRRSLLKGQPRLLSVLEVAAQRADWMEKRQFGRSLGLACYSILGSHVALVVEIQTRQNAVPRVVRVTCALDCGMVVNPDIVSAQVEGGIAFGLGAALKHAITIRNGQVEQTNFDSYPQLRFDEMPNVTVALMPSEASPSGAGEAATPGVAPALCNAIYAATGKRVRRLPVDAGSFE